MPEHGPLWNDIDTSAEGGPLTEDEFFAAMRDVMLYAPKPVRPLTSTRQQEQAWDAIERAERDAEQARQRMRLLDRGWRRLRLLARLRAATRYAHSTEFAATMTRTFGRRPVKVDDA